MIALFAIFLALFLFLYARLQDIAIQSVLEYRKKNLNLETKVVILMEHILWLEKLVKAEGNGGQYDLFEDIS